MISRRELLTAGMAGGFTARSEPSSDMAATQPEELAVQLRDISRNVQALDNTLSRAWLSNAVVFGFVDKVRAQFEVFFRTHQKFPDFLDVGLAVFLDLYDWHIKHQQPLQVTRGTDGRYRMQFMFSTVILRGEYEQNYIGIAYDRA